MRKVKQLAAEIAATILSFGSHAVPINTDVIAVVGVPGPASLPLLGLSLMSLIGLRRRQVSA